MKKDRLISGAFAALYSTTKETLLNCKYVRLLLPSHYGDNGYFYCDVEQFYDFYACDLASFLLNGVEKNAISLLPVRLSEVQNRFHPDTIGCCESLYFSFFGADPRIE